MHEADVLPGRNHPLGATVYPEGVAFNVYSRSATGAELLLYADAASEAPPRVVRLDPQSNRTFHFWHVFIAGARAGQHYAWRMQGPNDPARGHRFDGSKALIRTPPASTWARATTATRPAGPATTRAPRPAAWWSTAAASTGTATSRCGAPIRAR